MESASRLAGTTAIVSGALGDIGAAIAIALARAGADIGLGDIRPPAAAAGLITQIEAMDRRAHYQVVDVADAGNVREWVGAVEAQLGVPTLVVPNAAVATAADTRRLPPDEWSRVLSVNLDGAFYLAQAAANRMLENDTGGRIVFIGSWAAHAPHPNSPAYCVSKAGVRMLCRCMALELAPFDILVNEVAPGYVDAGLTAVRFRNQPGLRERAAEDVPAKRLIRSDEVAAQVRYLCEADNRHITGATIVMDGGLSLTSVAARSG